MLQDVNKFVDLRVQAIRYILFYLHPINFDKIFHETAHLKFWGAWVKFWVCIMQKYLDKLQNSTRHLALCLLSVKKFRSFEILSWISEFSIQIFGIMWLQVWLALSFVTG